ncbi:hypothetical protein BD413DRAFT_288943 [Trametes elegans]|nr:hypothetical protein BD413DRAFT_288943 [Trametes elegans]
MRSFEGSRWRGSWRQRWIFALTERVHGGEGIEGNEQHMCRLHRECVCGVRSLCEKASAEVCGQPSEVVTPWNSALSLPAAKS